MSFCTCSIMPHTKTQLTTFVLILTTCHLWNLYPTGNDVVHSVLLYLLDPWPQVSYPIGRCWPWLIHIVVLSAVFKDKTRTGNFSLYVWLDTVSETLQCAGSKTTATFSYALDDMLFIWHSWLSVKLRMTLYSYSVIRELNRPETLAGLSQTVVCVTFNLIRFFNPEKWTIQSVKKSEQKNTFNNFFNWKKKFKTWFKARQDRENDWRKFVRNIDLSRMNEKEKEILEFYDSSTSVDMFQSHSYSYTSLRRWKTSIEKIHRCEFTHL